MYDYYDDGVLMSPLFGGNITRKFSDIFPNLETFQELWEELPFKELGDVTDESVKLTYYLLVAQYNNSTIASTDEFQFEMNLFSRIWQHAPLWQREVDLQKEVRALSLSDITKGSKMISNHSYNPSTEPSTGSDTELTTINEQNVSIQKRDTLKAIMDYEGILTANPTAYYLSKFRDLFISIVEPQIEALFEGDDVSE